VVFLVAYDRVIVECRMNVVERIINVRDFSVCRIGSFIVRICIERIVDLDFGVRRRGIVRVDVRYVSAGISVTIRRRTARYYCSNRILYDYL
jgi:hypothetical protein